MICEIRSILLDSPVIFFDLEVVNFLSKKLLTATKTTQAYIKYSNNMFDSLQDSASSSAFLQVYWFQTTVSLHFIKLCVCVEVTCYNKQTKCVYLLRFQLIYKAVVVVNFLRSVLQNDKKASILFISSTSKVKNKQC